MWRANFFHDGYTQAGYVGPAPRLHGALRFSYRPALVEERSQLFDAARQLSAHLFDCHLARFLGQKLVDWDLADAQGRPIEPTAEALLRLPPELFVKLGEIILGTSASDVDPDWPAETREQILAEATEATLTGRPIGEVRQEHDEKNC